MSNAPSFADLLKDFMKRCHRTPAALSKLTEIPVRTIENWRDGTVKKPRGAYALKSLLLLAAHLPLDRADTTRLLRAAGQLSVDALIVQAQRDRDVVLLALLAPWLPAAEQPDPAAQRFEQRYRQTLLSGKLDRLEVFGIPVADHAAKQQRLSVAYVTLQAERLVQRDADFDDILDVQVGLLRRMGEQERRTITGDVDQVLAPVRRVLITAPAGAGKTTLVRWLAARAAAGDLPASMAAWHDSVPFYIRLRDLHRADGASQPFPKPSALPLVELPVLRDSVPDGWAEEALANGRALVLIDGVDELPQTQREAMLEWLRDLVAAYPDARYLLTSRPLRVNEQPWQEWEDWLDQQGFARIRLQDMGLPTIDRFIDHWHQALAERSPAQEAAEILELRGPLKALLRRRPALYALATTPLLCAMICTLHYELPNSLLERRMVLYKLCIEMSLKRNIKSKIADDPAVAQLDFEQKYHLLQEFAFRLTREGEMGVDRDSATQAFDYALTTMITPSNTTGEKVVRLFVEQVGLLHEPVEGRIEFVHRTFQEFLTAQAMLEAGEIKPLLKHALDDRWRETIVLAAGGATLRQANMLVGGLLDLARSMPEYTSFRERVEEIPVEETVPDEEGRNRLSQPHARLLTLALSCLETCIQLDDQLRVNVLEQACQLFPPQTIEEARLLAAAGRDGINYLRCRTDMDVDTAVACIHTLALIGLDKSLEKIREFLAFANDDVVCQILCDNWSYFDRMAYLQYVLCGMERLVLDTLPSAEECTWLGSVSHLSVSTPEKIDLDNVRHLPSLTQLDLWGVSGADLTVLQELPTLRTLVLADVSGVDLKPLQHLPALTRLDLSRVSGVDLGVLQHLRELRTLDLSHISEVDLSGLRYLTALTTLVLRGISGVDLRQLQYLPALKTLILSDVSGVDLKVLQHLHVLTKLDLCGVSGMDLTGLQNLPALETLELSYVSGVDLMPLRYLPTLTTLNLSYVSGVDLSVLRHLPALMTLDLWGASGVELEALQYAPTLTKLVLSGVSGKDLKVLQHLPSLTALNVSGVSGVDLTQLQHLSALTILELWDVSGVDLMPLQRLSALTTLDLSRASKVDLTPLQHLPALQEVVFAGPDLLRDLSPLAAIRGLRLKIRLRNDSIIREKLEQQGFRIDSMTRFDNTDYDRGYIVQLQ